MLTVRYSVVCVLLAALFAVVVLCSTAMCTQTTARGVGGGNLFLRVDGSAEDILILQQPQKKQMEKKVQTHKQQAETELRPNQADKKTKAQKKNDFPSKGLEVAAEQEPENYGTTQTHRPEEPHNRRGENGAKGRLKLRRGERLTTKKKDKTWENSAGSTGGKKKKATTDIIFWAITAELTRLAAAAPLTFATGGTGGVLCFFFVAVRTLSVYVYVFLLALPNDNHNMNIF